MKPHRGRLGVVTQLLTLTLIAWRGALPLHAEVPNTLPGQTPAGVSAANAASARDSLSWHARQGTFYQRQWGIDVVDVRRVASGEMLAFRYIVLDPDKAKPLNEVRNTAYLVDERTGVHLKVPQMEKVGSLRTTVSPKTGRMYWMVFANTGKQVDAGSLVDVVIGEVHINGLTVQAK